MARRDDEEHYRILFEHNPQPMWVYDPDTLEFLTVNEAAIARYGYSHDEFLRMRITDIRPPDDVPALLDSVSSQAEAFQLSGVWRHRRKDGGLMLVEITSHDLPFDDRRGRLVLATDVTQRELALEELRRGNEAYERQYAALAALTQRGILQTTDPEAALREITQNTANTLGVERVSVWRLTTGRDAIVAQDLFERSAARHSSGLTLEATAYPAYFRALAGSDVLVVDDAERDPRTSEFTESYLRPYGITSMLDAPVLVAGDLAGVLCLEHVGPQRSWTAGERSFAVSAANLLALLIAQQSLSESRAWLQAILDSEPECVSLVGRDGRVLDINPAGRRMVEATDRESVVGSDAIQLIHPSHRAEYLDLHRKVHAGASGQLQFRIVGLQGTERWVETHAAPLRASSGDVVAVISVMHDISERIRSEDALRESQRRLSTLMNNLPGMAYRCPNEPDRPMEFVSNGAAALTGYDPADLLQGGSRSYGELIHPADREQVWDRVQTAVRTREPFELEYRITSTDGTEKWVWERGQAVYGLDGQTVAIEGLVSDMTQRRQLEDQLLHSQKMESVGRLAGGIAHDFNNLLTVILGTVDLALTEIDAADPLSADIGEIRDAAERAAGLTQQLLAFSRRQVMHLRVIDINATIASTLAMLRRLIGEDVEIRFTPGAALWNVRADPGQLEQVLLNLAVNARDAMPTGGLLSIGTRNLEVDEAYVAGHPSARPGSSVAITISDSGVGMDDTVRERAFEPFFTTKPVGTGTGLGLATVYGIVQQSGGSIHLYSEPGHGTTFRILLPRAGAGADTEAPTRLTPPEGGSETILLVEDEAAVRRLTERVLVSAGYSVIAVANAADALTSLEAQVGPVHLLLSDVVLAHISGPELARRLTGKSPATRVLFMSGYTDDAMVRHGLLGGHTRCLEKPFTVAELTQAVRDVLSA